MSSRSRHNYVLGQRFGQRPVSRRPANYRRPLAFEPLERRDLLATFTVTSLADDGGGALMTLREAITAANSNGTATAVSPHIINFAVTGTIQLTSAGDDHLNVENHVSIQGPGANLLTIRAHDPNSGDGNGRRVFYIVGDGTLGVTISGVTMTNGDQSSGEDLTGGGGIYSEENLALIDCVVDDNFAQDGGGIMVNGGSLTLTRTHISNNRSSNSGAGIWSYGRPVTVIDSTISANHSEEHGGGIYSYNGGTLTITGTTISGNSADANADLGINVGGGGGGILKVGGALTIENSTISGNTTGQAGGGILLVTSSTSSIKSSTISGNVANERGGGIYSDSDSNDLTVSHSTIAFNSSPSGGGTGAGFRSTSTSILNHSIVSNNTRGGSASDLSGTFTTNFSLIGNTSGATINGANNQLNAAANLAPLADSGGRTMTHALLSGSLAIDNGDAAIVGAPSFDQRGSGFPRIVDGNNDAIARIDIGAYERSQPSAEIAVTGNGQEIADGDTTPGTSDDTDFGSTPQGGATVSHTFTVRNDGTGTLTLGAVSVPDGFTVTDPLETSLAGSASDTLTVRLDTTTAGTKTGDVSFTTNDGDETTFNFSITGVVTIPEIAVTGNGQEITDGDTTPGTSDDTDFGSTPHGGATVSHTFTVRNDGTGTLTLGAVSVPDGFTVTDPLETSLAGGASDTLTVRLDTTTAGTKTGDVSFTTNDGDETTFNFSITGVVTIPEIAVTGNGQEITDGDTTPGTSDDTDFGSTPHGGATVSHTFTVRNDGTGTLTLGAVSVPDGFTVTDPLETSLAGGASDTLTVRLDTTTAGTKTGDVSFTTNDGDETTFNFSITGVVITAIPELPGDYNRDGNVDAADFVMWVKTFGLTVPQYEGADGDGDTSVGNGDYPVWTENFGESSTGSGGGSIETSHGDAELFAPNSGSPLALLTADRREVKSPTSSRHALVESQNGAIADTADLLNVLSGVFGAADKSLIESDVDGLSDSDSNARDEALDELFAGIANEL